MAAKRKTLAEEYGNARLGTLNGMSVIVSSVAASAGAWLAGLVVDATGSYARVLAAATPLQTLAVVALLWQRAAEPVSGATGCAGASRV